MIHQNQLPAVVECKVYLGIRSMPTYFSVDIVYTHLSLPSNAHRGLYSLLNGLLKSLRVTSKPTSPGITAPLDLHLLSNRQGFFPTLLCFGEMSAFLENVTFSVKAEVKVSVIVTSVWMWNLSFAFDPTPQGSSGRVRVMLRIGIIGWSNHTKSNPEYLVPSKEAMVTTYIVLSMPQPGNEPTTFQS